MLRVVLANRQPLLARAAAPMAMRSMSETAQAVRACWERWCSFERERVSFVCVCDEGDCSRRVRFCARICARRGQGRRDWLGPGAGAGAKREGQYAALRSLGSVRDNQPSYCWAIRVAHLTPARTKPNIELSPMPRPSRTSLRSTTRRTTAIRSSAA